MCAIIGRGLYISLFFTPFFSVVYTVEQLILSTSNLCTKQGSYSIFGYKIRGLQSRAGYNGAFTVVLDATS